MNHRPASTSPHTNRQRRAGCRRRSRGFTFIELCLGLVITSLIAGAIASFMLSVSTCWHASEELQTATIRANQFTERLAARLRDAKRIGYWQDAGAGQAGLLYWRDLNNDGEMASSEMGLIQYEPITHTIDLYLSTSDSTWETNQIIDSSAWGKFLAGLTPEPMIRNVSAADLTVTNGLAEDVAPTVTWTLSLTESDSTVVSRTCSASLRGPATPP